VSVVDSLNPASDGGRYDVAIATRGYETRARCLATRFQPEARLRIAGGFAGQQALQYAENRHWFSTHRWRTVDLDDAAFGGFWRDILARATHGRSDVLRVWLDISSNSRLRIATLLDLFRTLSCPVVVDFVYCAAKFSPPPRSHPPNGHVGPVTRSFAGWTEPDRSSVALVGLGYEQDKALGAVEHIQATDVWVFSPVSAESEYASVLKTANAILLSSVPRNRVVEYIVERPFDCFVVLESLAYRISQDRVPVFFPFGPKIFTLCSMLVACLHSEKVAVWRVSAGAEEEAVDRLPSESVCGLRVAFGVPSGGLRKSA